MYIAGSQIVDEWVVLDFNSDPLGGLTGGSGAGGFTNADFKLSLRRQSGATFVASSEVVALAETSVSGHYAITVTPQNNGLYILHLKELDPLAMGRVYDFRWVVVPAGAVFVPSFTNAFCSEQDVERWLQFAIDTTTNPTDLETAAFAETRAAILMSLCVRNGLDVTPATVASYPRLQDMLRDANAIGAALDYTIAQQMRVQPSKSDRIDLYMKLWTDYVGGSQPGFVTESVGLIEKEVMQNASLATDHILSGDTQAAPAVQAVDTGIQIGMGTLF
jgi:hypothetical protein